MKLIATCKLGLESTVAFQLRALGMENVQAEDARVMFEGDETDLCRAALWLRTAERLLLEIGSFPAETFDELFEGTKKLPWRQYLGRNTRIHVNGKSAKSKLFSVSDCQSIVKKAIVENLKAAYRTNILPESAEEVIVEVGILRDRASLTLDCCGAGLSRRGYRTFNVAAPLSETLGAAIVLLSRYRADDTFVDPMCGSGTMPIEAAMIAQNRAPGLNRRFSAEDWTFLPASCWVRAREEARDSIRNVPLDILGSDIDDRCIQVCKQHAKKAGVMVNWAVRSLKDFEKTNEKGVLVVNPPYGERLMEKTDAANLYQQMRDVFANLPGWSKNIISGYRDFEKAYGKRADKRRKLSNGGLTCTLYQYFRERPTNDFGERWKKQD